MESVSKTHPQFESTNKRSGLAFVLFAALYAFYIHIVLLFASQTIVDGIRIPGVDTAFLLSAGMFYLGMAVLYIAALVVLAALYFVQTEAKRLAVVGVILPIVALYIARAVITAYHPVTIYP